MSKRIFKSSGFTPVAVADTTNFTDLGHMTIQGGSTTQLVKITQIDVDGLATASAPTPLQLALDSTVGATLTALTTGESDAPLHPSVAALAAPAKVFTQSTTKPKRAATLGLMPMGLNAFGGVNRWQGAPDGEFWLLGNAVNAGEISLSCYTGGTPGLVSAAITYEPL
jgi:hypothetical protein